MAGGEQDPWFLVGEEAETIQEGRKKGPKIWGLEGKGVWWQGERGEEGQGGEVWDRALGRRVVYGIVREVWRQQ